MTGAWVLELGAQRRVAVGVREQVELLSASAARERSGAPACCRYELDWNGRVVPVVDLGIALDGRACEGPQRLIGVYAFEDGRARLAAGALWLARPPRLVQVDDSAACPLPADWNPAAGIALSCFALDGHAVPIVDLAAVFTGRLIAANERDHGCELSLSEDRK